MTHRTSTPRRLITDADIARYCREDELRSCYSDARIDVARVRLHDGRHAVIHQSPPDPHRVEGLIVFSSTSEADAIAYYQQRYLDSAAYKII